MTDKYLVAIEISKKQNYIFKSNKLKENIGASLIIKYVTEDLPKKYLYENNGEIVFQGGGGSFFKFEKKENATDFIKELSFKIMREYPEIEFFASYVDYTNEVEGEKEVRKKISDKKLARQSRFKKVSFGVEEICRTSGLPANSRINDGKGIRAVSIDTEKKFTCGKNKDNKLGILDIIQKDLEDIKEVDLGKIKKKYKFSEFKSEEYDFPYDLDKFKKEGNSKLAVVAIDGNGMGDMVDKLKVSFENNQENYFNKLKEFSDGIDKCYKDAFKKVVEVIENNKKSEENEDGIEFLGNKYIPIRPIILAGDDVCYIVESSIALETANIFIKELEKISGKFIGELGIELGVEKLTACGGVAFVNKKYPFFKACELAEGLCNNAKTKIKKINEKFKEKEKEINGKSKNKETVIKEISMLDWHISKGELSNDIKEIRKRYENLKYTYIDREEKEKEMIADYNIKPIFISGENDLKKYQLSYIKFKEMIKKLKDNRRSKLKELINEIPNGKSSVDLFIEKYKLEKLFLDLDKCIFEEENEKSIFRKVGKNEIILYYDALEIMDDFKELKEGENQ